MMTKGTSRKQLRNNQRRPCWMLCLLVVVSSAVVSVASASKTVLMDGAGAAISNLQVQSIPSSITASDGIVTVVSSPGTPSFLVKGDEDDNDVLCLVDDSPSNRYLQCRGPTLRGSSEAERVSLATCSLVAGAVLLDGVTPGDVESGLQYSRHARTLTGIFQARLVDLATPEGGGDGDEAGASSEESGSENDKKKQTIILGVLGNLESTDADEARKAVRSLYDAAAAERKGATSSFDDVYDLELVPVASSTECQSAVSLAVDAAKRFGGDESVPLSLALAQAFTTVRDTQVADLAQDPPHIAHAFVDIRNTYTKQLRTVRAKVAAWKSRVSRGLWVDGYGKQAQSLRDSVLQAYDETTLWAAGLPVVANYRYDLRVQLQTLLDTVIEELYTAQVANLEKSTLKRLQRSLMKTMNDPAESLIDSNAAAVRGEAFNFESLVDDLQVPSLGLTKEKAARDIASKLNDAVLAFPDSPAAKIRRTQEVKKTVNKERKPNERAISFGLDLVAVLRPDGFGSLQGFAGYQLPGGSSVTFGVHNDADDPQVIAQFGGVRPPLLRVQPKLRLDIDV